MQNLMELAEKPFISGKNYDFRPGDTVQVFHKIVEGESERVQVYEGQIIGIKGGGLTKNIIVRKLSFGVGVEKTFPLHSPRVEDIRIIKHAKVRRAKLYYLRDKIGKESRLKEARESAGIKQDTRETIEQKPENNKVSL